MNNALELPQMLQSTLVSNTISPADLMGAIARFGAFQDAQVNHPQPIQRFQQPQKEPITMPNTQRRLVQIFIADPDENVPLDQCLLYSGDQRLTDLTDQELFFEIDLKTILAAHNEARVKLVNKAVKERTEHLEPARVRDLKMTVVTIAQF